MIDNWGLHGRRCKEATLHLFIGWSDLAVSWFNGGGGANMTLKYKGPDSDDKWAFPKVHTEKPAA